MDVNIMSKEIIPCSIDSKVAWNSVLKYMIQKEDTPVDIACESRFISYEMIYYPIERVKINYKAQWQAESIFIRRWTETETYLKPEIHYFDRWGTEHKHPGFDYLDPKTHKWRSGTFNPITSRVKGYSGSVGTKPWTPTEVTVEATRENSYEEETGRENSSGTVNDSILDVLAERYPFFNILYGNYNSKERLPYSDEALKKAIVDGIVLINNQKKNELVKKAENIAQKQCEGRIPGQKYRNFYMDFTYDISSEIWYYPAYKIVYMYQNRQYECLVSGCTVDCVYETAHPIDSTSSNLLSPANLRSSELIEKRKKVTKTIAISILIGSVVEFISILMVLSKLISLFIGQGGFLGLFLWLAIMAGTGYFVYQKFLERKTIVSKNENIHAEKDNMIRNRQDRKKKIFDIITDDRLNNDEKREKCKTI